MIGAPKWAQGTGQHNQFPFLFVQLANFLEKKPEPVDSSWAGLREAQRQSLSEANTAMVVAIDKGEWNDIHPVDKKTLGQRLALAARAVALGEKVDYQGPELTSVRAEGAKLKTQIQSQRQRLSAERHWQQLRNSWRRWSLSLGTGSAKRSATLSCCRTLRLKHR